MEKKTSGLTTRTTSRHSQNKVNVLSGIVKSKRNKNAVQSDMQIRIKSHTNTTNLRLLIIIEILSFVGLKFLFS